MSIATDQLLGSPPYRTTIGAVALGGVFGLMLYGLSVHQTYRYYRLYPKDRFPLKVFVLVIFGLETFHTLLWVIVAYHYLIAEPFISGGLAKGDWSVRLTVLSTACTVCTTQCFYACRVYLIGPEYRWLVAPAMTCLLVSKGFAITAGVSAFTATPSIADFQRISWLVSVSYGLAGVTDVTLAGTLVFVLYRLRTGSRRADSVLDILMIYTINTGVLTSVFSILAFVFALIMPGNLIYAGLSIIGTKLYANSVLAVLNSRREIGSRFLDDFTSFALPELPQGARDSRLRGTMLSSLVWNPPQPSASMSDCESLGQSEGMTFAAGEEGVHDNGQGVDALKAGFEK